MYYCMLDTNWGTDLVLDSEHHHIRRYMSHRLAHSTASHSHTTQNSILRNSLVNIVHTSMYQYLLSTYSIWNPY
jgi:hypothetical protein